MKKYKTVIAQESHFLIAIAITDHNPLIQIILAKDHQADENYKMIHKLYIADQLIKTTNTEILFSIKLKSE